MQAIFDLFKAPYWCSLFLLMYLLSMALYPWATYCICRSYYLYVNGKCTQEYDPLCKKSESLMVLLILAIVAIILLAALATVSCSATLGILLSYFLSMVLVRYLTHQVRHCFWVKHLAKCGIPESRLHLW